jgi:hypothetical protein
MIDTGVLSYAFDSVISPMDTIHRQQIQSSLHSSKSGRFFGLPAWLCLLPPPLAGGSRSPGASSTKGNSVQGRVLRHRPQEAKAQVAAAVAGPLAAAMR